MTTTDANGIVFLEETDAVSPLHTLINGLQQGTSEAISLLQDTLLPIGTIMQFGGSAAPTDFLLCQGQAVSRDTYADLFAIIGSSYGNGNGTTTFNVPDLQSRVPVGLSSETEFNTLGKTGGAKTHTLTIPEIPSHTHPVRGTSQMTAGISFTPANESGSPTDNRFHAANGSPAIAAQATGGGGAHNNLQPYVTVNYIIKY